MTDQYCSKCRSRMDMIVTDCSQIGRWVGSDGLTANRQFRKDTGEEIMVRMWVCPNFNKRTNNNWFQVNVLGHAKYEQHDKKAEFINHDNPHAVIL